MDKELERLQKEINGKVSLWVSEDESFAIESIMIWPPDGDQVSVKPYGYDPEELYILLNLNGRKDSIISLEELRSPQFCLSDYPISCSKVVLQNLANVKEGGTHNFNDIMGNQFAGLFGTGNPSCPYG
jgi:hypothetical protein